MKQYREMHTMYDDPTGENAEVQEVPAEATQGVEGAE